METMPSSPIRQAWWNRSGPISPCSKSDRKIPSTRRPNSLARLVLRAKRQLAEILAVAHEDVEVVKLHPVIMPARVQAIEI